MDHAASARVCARTWMCACVVCICAHASGVASPKNWGGEYIEWG